METRTKVRCPNKLKSVSLQILVSILLTVIIFSGGWGISDIRQTLVLEKERRARSLRQAAERLSFNLGYSMWNFNLVEVKKNIENEALDENINSIRVFDEDGNLYTQYSLDKEVKKDNLKEIDRDGHRPVQGSNAETVSRNIIYKNRIIGKVIVSANPKPLQLLIRQLEFKLCKNLLILIGSLICVQFFVLRKVIIKPLSLLKDWAASFGPENMAPPPRLFPSAEINTLVTSFSQMTQRLVLALNEICDKNHALLKSQDQVNRRNEELMAIQIDLQKAVAKSEESDRLKTAFLTNMSHEIRTPMNGILGFTDLLELSDISEDEKKSYIQIIKKSGARLLHIINQILDISKIEAGQVEIHIVESNIYEPIQFVYDLLKPEAEMKNIEFTFNNGTDDREDTLFTDQEKFYAIVINLVKNAIKYTEKGSIEFGYRLPPVSSALSPADQNEFQFYVKDTGIGIPPDRQKAIFERFEQSDIIDIQAREGVGLGLSISKAYVEMLGGKIWLESDPNQGSTFYFSHPLQTKHLSMGQLSV